MLSYYVIYYEKFRKVMQQTEKEAVITDIIYNEQEESTSSCLIAKYILEPWISCLTIDIISKVSPFDKLFFVLKNIVIGLMIHFWDYTIVTDHLVEYSGGLT